MSEEKIRDLALKIGQAIDFCHKRGVIIKNLDTKGILMRDKESYNLNKFGCMCPKIICIDGCQILAEDQKTIGCMGDVRYRAPEVVGNKPYSFKADSWTFGIIIYFLIAKRHPFDVIERFEPLNFNDLDE